MKKSALISLLTISTVIGISSSSLATYYLLSSKYQIAKNELTSEYNEIQKEQNKEYVKLQINLKIQKSASNDKENALNKQIKKLKHNYKSLENEISYKNELIKDLDKKSTHLQNLEQKTISQQFLEPIINQEIHNSNPEFGFAFRYWVDGIEYGDFPDKLVTEGEYRGIDDTFYLPKENRIGFASPKIKGQKNSIVYFTLIDENNHTILTRKATIKSNEFVRSFMFNVKYLSKMINHKEIFTARWEIEPYNQPNKKYIDFEYDVRLIKSISNKK